MKALEKAAKDRGDAKPVSTTSPAAEPPGRKAPPAAAVGAPAAAAPPPATAAAKPALELTLEPLTADTPPQPAEEARPVRSERPSREQSRAATVLQATSGSGATAAVSKSRMRPMVVIGIITALCAVALAIYVYLQITNPGLFISRPPAPPAPLVKTPAPAPAVPAPIATGSIVAPETAAETKASAPAVEPAPVQRPAPPATPAVQQAVTAAPHDSIKVSAGSAEARLDPRLAQGYASLQSGNLDAARQAYSEAARSEPRSTQALLGLAAIAMNEGRAEDASRLYFDILDLEPRNAYAQAGLISLMGRADPVGAEAKLKQLIAREPLASLYFTLGNLYGDQSRWSEAQQAYFRAHNLEPANPDYAYNLAVGLEHVGQHRLALGFYRHAVSRASATGRSGFNLSQAQERIRQLASQAQ